MGTCVRADGTIKRLSTRDQQKGRESKIQQGDRQKIERESREYSKERKLRARDGEACSSHVD